ncbi:MAG: sensor domain-containing diguanylate cyclase [Halopseudomonas sp.]
MTMSLLDKDRSIPPSIFILVGGVAAVVLLLILSLWNEYHADLRVAQANSTYVAELTGANVRRSLDDLSEALHNTRTAGRFIDAAATPEQRRRAFEVFSEEILQRKRYIRTFSVASPDGQILHWNRDQARPNIADRKYVKHHLDHPGSDIYLSQPIRSMLDDEWIVVASLPIRTTEGGLKAILIASISPDFFAPQLDSLTALSGTRLGVATYNGEIIWADEAQTASTVPLAEQSNSAWQQLSGTGRAEYVSASDGTLQLMAYQKLEQYPVVTVATVSKSQVLQDWRTQRAISLVSILLLLIGTAVVGRRLLVDHRLLLTQHHELKTLAMSDPLTGLANRRHLWEHAKQLIAAAERYQFSRSVIMLDIDHFKRVNDTYGHDVGDEVIKALADTIADAARETDLACRLGGEEFAIVLSHTNVDQAIKLAERLRQRVALLSFSSPQWDLSITISLGVAVLDKDLDDALKQADEALYFAKNNGRNQVVNAASLALGSAAAD